MTGDRIPVTRGQVWYEAELLRKKIKVRRGGVDGFRLKRLQGAVAEDRLEVNSVFTLIEGGIEAWEKIY